MYCTLSIRPYVYKHRQCLRAGKEQRVRTSRLYVPGSVLFWPMRIMFSFRALCSCGPRSRTGGMVGRKRVKGSRCPSGWGCGFIRLASNIYSGIQWLTSSYFIIYSIRTYCHFIGSGRKGGYRERCEYSTHKLPIVPRTLEQNRTKRNKNKEKRKMTTICNRITIRYRRVWISRRVTEWGWVGVRESVVPATGIFMRWWWWWWSPHTYSWCRMWLWFSGIK